MSVVVFIVNIFQVTSNSTTTAMDQNGEDRPTSPTEEAGLKTIQAKTETDCVKDEEYTSSEAKHNGVDEDKEKSEKVRYRIIYIFKICICPSVHHVYVFLLAESNI